MAEKNFFKLKNNNEVVRGIVDNFIVRVGEIETGKQVVFAYRTRIDTCASHILDVLGFSFENVDGVREMLRYMNQRIPRQLQEYIGKNINKVNSLNKEISRVGAKKDPEYEFISDDVKSNPDRAEGFNNSRKFQLMIRIFKYQPNMKNLNAIISMVNNDNSIIHLI